MLDWGPSRLRAFSFGSRFWVNTEWGGAVPAKGTPTLKSVKRVIGIRVDAQ